MRATRPFTHTGIQNRHVYFGFHCYALVKSYDFQKECTNPFVTVIGYRQCFLSRGWNFQPLHCAETQKRATILLWVLESPAFQLRCDRPAQSLVEHAASINLLKPNVYVMHQQFNIQQLYVLPTLYLCVLYLSENRWQFLPHTK